MQDQLEAVVAAPSYSLGAVLIPSAIASLIAIWGVFSHRVIARRKATMDQISENNNDRDMIKAQRKFIELAAKDGGLAKWAENDQESSEEAGAIRLVLNDFELISCSIQYGIMDYNFYKKFNHGTVKRYWKAAAPFIMALRDRVGSSTLYCEFEALHDWITENRRPSRSRWWKNIF